MSKINHKRDSHYFNCGTCGYVGLESELKPDKSHPCGKDECPECNADNCIFCCFKSYKDAENHFNDK